MFFYKILATTYGLKSERYTAKPELKKKNRIQNNFEFRKNMYKTQKFETILLA